MQYKLVFSNNAISSCFFLLFLNTNLYLKLLPNYLILMQNSKSLRNMIKEAKAEMEIPIAIAKTKVRKFSI